MTMSLEELARRTTPEWRPPPVAARPPAEVDPVSAALMEDRRIAAERMRAESLRREEERRRREAEREEAEAEAAALEAEMKRDAIRQDRKEQIAALRAANGGGGGGGGELVTALFGMVQGMQQQIAEMSTAGNEKIIESLNARLEQQNQQLTAMLSKPEPDPLDTITRLLELQSRLEELTGGGRRTGPAAGQDVRDYIELKKAEAEMARIDANTRIDEETRREQMQLKREEIQAIHNRNMMMGGALAEFGPKMANALAARIVGGAGATAPQAGTATVMQPWTCPREDCNQVNMAPPNATSATCAHCHQFVTLTPRDAPPITGPGAPTLPAGANGHTPPAAPPA